MLLAAYIPSLNLPDVMPFMVFINSVLVINENKEFSEIENLFFDRHFVEKFVYRIATFSPGPYTLFWDRYCSQVLVKRLIR